MKILVTGGAGFIGSHLVDRLIEQGHEVRIFDNLTEQVHQGKIPEYLNPKAEFIKGDVLDRAALAAALAGIDVVFHFASAVGVGQSQYQIYHYVNTNVGGTANLLDIIVNDKLPIRKVIVAASMSSYGEGLYNCDKCGAVRPELRSQVVDGDWEPRCPLCGGTVKPIPTNEKAVQYCNSIYALTKKAQEDMVTNIGRTYNIPTVALRFFNVYGPRQSLSNPYTGVAAIFMSRIKNGNSPVIYEDGLQTRDFVSVYDIADANIAAMNSASSDYEVFNVGSGTALPIKEVAEILAKLYGNDVKPEITSQFRKGDVRHCFADMTKAKEKLGWQPKISFEQGMADLIAWSRDAEAVDSLDKAIAEMKEKGLV
ncbi:MAG: SDR family NAD(P)-dependent oxidoreductase [Patescibacteria group bacterium]|jgi:dTDP-L-rhamnose 4-epimerase